MEKIRCEFVDSYDNLDFKKAHGISFEESNAIVCKEDKKYYTTRNQIIFMIRKAGQKNQIINSKKKNIDYDFEYTFVIRENDTTKELKISIPEYLYLNDQDVQNKMRILDFYEGKAINVRIKTGLKNALFVAIAIAGTIATGCAVVNGVEKTFDINDKNSQEYYDNIVKAQAREKANEPINVNFEENDISYTAVNVKTR